ncbi:phosphatase PAP2 family protein [Labrenzia sp. PHM005]|uniref:phosphatase PAP2 family protein n=1 Tax=Labrenzia sp. PHM005 TaxID=2590016 RepID=UPI00114061CB|nr:phosphatase PAP2 family protein [Labrenzia sp. PHM005]QDG76407.1 phosphatase PAP2 family protein [Labrenzia sp. PHM005]
MALETISFVSTTQSFGHGDHGDHGDHKLHGDFSSTAGTPPIATPALIMNHAVLSGPWVWDPCKKPDHLPFNDPANVLLWTQDVRAMIVQQEIASKVIVETDIGSSEISPSKQGDSSETDKVVVRAQTGAQNKDVIAVIDRPSEVLFSQQLQFLEYYADQRLERAAEITLQLRDIISNFVAILPLRPERKRWTLEFIRMCLRAVSLIEMQVKHMMACRRPDCFWPQVQPMIQTPSHSCYPSGHGTEAFLLATLLRHFAKSSLPHPATDWSTAWYGEVSKQLLRQAARIAQNRVVAGVHFPIDNAAGAVLGVSVANFILKLADASATDLFGRSFNSANFGGSNDFTHTTANGILDRGNLSTPGNAAFSTELDLEIPHLEGSSALSAVYQQAKKEWQDPTLS